MWRLFGDYVSNNSWLWQVFIFGVAFFGCYAIMEPCLYFYRANNVHRTYEAAIKKEKAHKKKLREAEEAEAAASGEAAEE